MTERPKHRSGDPLTEDTACRSGKKNGRGKPISPGKVVFREADTQVTFEEFMNAIRGSNGTLTNVANILGISIYFVKQTMTKYKHLLKEFTEFAEERLDNVQNAFYCKALNGDTTAQIFYLKCQGKERGWIEKAEANIQKAPVRVKLVPAKGTKRYGKKSDKVSGRSPESLPADGSGVGEATLH